MQISEPNPVNTLSTPSKRGHRHRRSLAISGDFDFLKQPAAIVNLSPPQAAENCPSTAPTAVSSTLRQYATIDFLAKPMKTLER